jgi:hypothetical protein
VLPHTSVAASLRGARPHDARQSDFRGSGLLRVPGLEGRCTGFLRAPEGVGALARTRPPKSSEAACVFGGLC